MQFLRIKAGQSFRKAYFFYMLISFAVENHRSVRERQILNLEATSDDHLAESRVIEADGVRILRSAAIYGPNASGKSNLVDAMHHAPPRPGGLVTLCSGQSQDCG